MLNGLSHLWWRSKAFAMPLGAEFRLAPRELAGTSVPRERVATEVHRWTNADTPLRQAETAFSFQQGGSHG